MVGYPTKALLALAASLYQRSERVGSGMAKRADCNSCAGFTPFLVESSLPIVNFSGANRIENILKKPSPGGCADISRPDFGHLDLFPPRLEKRRRKVRAPLFLVARRDVRPI